MSQAELLFDGKPLKTLKDYDDLFQAMSEAAKGLQPEFEKNPQTDPLVIAAFNMAMTFTALGNGDTKTLGISWGLAANLLKLVAQGRLTFKFVESPNEFDVNAVLAEALRIINEKKS